MAPSIRCPAGPPHTANEQLVAAMQKRPAEMVNPDTGAPNNRVHIPKASTTTSALQPRGSSVSGEPHNNIALDGATVLAGLGVLEARKVGIPELGIAVSEAEQLDAGGYLATVQAAQLADRVNDVVFAVKRADGLERTALVGIADRLLVVNVGRSFGAGDESLPLLIEIIRHGVRISC